MSRDGPSEGGQVEYPCKVLCFLEMGFLIKYFDTEHLVDDLNFFQVLFLVAKVPPADLDLSTELSAAELRKAYQCTVERLAGDDGVTHRFISQNWPQIKLSGRDLERKPLFFRVAGEEWLQFFDEETSKRLERFRFHCGGMIFVVDDKTNRVTHPVRISTGQFPSPLLSCGSFTRGFLLPEPADGFLAPTISSNTHQRCPIITAASLSIVAPTQPFSPDSFWNLGTAKSDSSTIYQFQGLGGNRAAQDLDFVDAMIRELVEELHFRTTIPKFGQRLILLKSVLRSLFKDLPNHETCIESPGFTEQAKHRCRWGMFHINAMALLINISIPFDLLDDILQPNLSALGALCPEIPELRPPAEISERFVILNRDQPFKDTGEADHHDQGETWCSHPFLIWVKIQRADEGAIKGPKGHANDQPPYYNHNLNKSIDFGNWDAHIQRLNPQATSASFSTQELPLTHAPPRLPDLPISGRGNSQPQSHRRPKSKGRDVAEIEHLPATSISKPQGHGRGRGRGHGRRHGRGRGRGHGRGCAPSVAVAERPSKL